MYKVMRVENPKHQDMDEIVTNYWDNWLLISNLTKKPRGGIVQYYCTINKDELWEHVMEMDKDFQTYGDCIVRFVGPSRGDSPGEPLCAHFHVAYVDSKNTPLIQFIDFTSNSFYRNLEKHDRTGIENIKLLINCVCGKDYLIFL